MPCFWDKSGREKDRSLPFWAVTRVWRSPSAAVMCGPACGMHYVSNTGDVVTEAANGGYDAVVATVSFTLSADVEALYMNGSGLTGTGNSDADILVTIGANTLVGAGGNDMFVFLAGSADSAAVADFDGDEGDVLVFSGFGTAAQGATFSQIGATDQWQLHSGVDGHTETITLANGAAPDAGDFMFV